MTEEALTFSELRKIQKEEKRQEKPSELDQNFLLRVSEYLSMKESTDEREYRNAKRVFDKIIGLRQEKILKNAKIAVKSEVKGSDLNLLPRESEFFRDVKEKFKEYDSQIQDVIDGEESLDIDEDIMDESFEESSQEDKFSEDEDEEDIYTDVEVLSEVPEFMGTDLESYGPFEEGEEAEIPEENAEILENRGKVEVID